VRLLVATVVCGASLALAADRPAPLRSGVEFTGSDARALQADDVANPGMLWVSRGEKLWSEPAGTSGKSCADCHGDAAKSMKGVAARTVHLEERINDGRKIWKLSPMDLKSYSRWFDYSRARDEMFAATDTDFAPWYVADSNDKRRARLNIIAHLLGKIPYKQAPREKVKLPKRQKAGGYKEPNYRFKRVDERY